MLPTRRAPALRGKYVQSLLANVVRDEMNSFTADHTSSFNDSATDFRGRAFAFWNIKIATNTRTPDVTSRRVQTNRFLLTPRHPFEANISNVRSIAIVRSDVVSIETHTPFHRSSRRL